LDDRNSEYSPERVARELLRGHVDIHRILVELENDESLSDYDARIAICSKRSRCPVKGREEVWELILWQLIMNAAKVPTEDENIIEISLEFDSDDDRASAVDISIRNAVPERPSDAQISQWDGALQSKFRYLAPDPDSEDSMGLGLATVGQLLQVMGIRRNIKYEDGSIVVTMLEVACNG